MFNLYKFFDTLSDLNVKIRLDAGQPDIPVDERIISALIASLRRGETKYVSVNGIGELREKIAEEHGVDAGEVIIGPGSKSLVASQILSSDKVAVISPYWPTYVQMAKCFGKKIQIIETSLEDRWLPNFELLERDVDLIIVNYPNNPTGISISKGKVRELLDLSSQIGAKVVSDEVYRDIVFNDRFTSLLDFNYEGTVFIHSFSKTFSMTGFRIGYAVACKREIDKIRRFLEATSTCVPEFIQHAALKALEIKEEVKRRVVGIYRERVRLVKRELSEEKFEFIEPDGGIYVFPRLKTGSSGIDFTYRLAEMGVGVFPGEAFGGYDSYIRISLTDSNLEKGIKLMNKLSDAP